MYGDKILSHAHCGNFWCKIPLAPVIMVARRTPDVARFIISAQACSSVFWCKSSVTCAGGGNWDTEIYADSFNSARTRRRVASSFGTNSVSAIFAISKSDSCFIVTRLYAIFYKVLQKNTAEKNRWFIFVFLSLLFYPKNRHIVNKFFAENKPPFYVRGVIWNYDICLLVRFYWCGVPRHTRQQQLRKSALLRRVTLGIMHRAVY